MKRSLDEYKKLGEQKKCVVCESSVTNRQTWKDGYMQHMCDSTGMAAWYCGNEYCNYSFHSENMYGHSGPPMMCPSCGQDTLGYNAY